MKHWILAIVALAIVLAIALSAVYWFDVGSPSKGSDATDTALVSDHYKQFTDTESPVLNPEQALASFRLAPGFSLELVAAEPQVANPVAMDWDQQGRLYVVEMRGYMMDSLGTGETQALGRVVRLEDSNGDGRMNSSVEFLAGLVNPRAIMVFENQVFIAEPPNLWRCDIVPGQSQCANKEKIANYGDGDPHLVEHTENGLLLGVDNWIYNAKSNRRFSYRQQEWQESLTTFRGQWGISQDDSGLLYTNSNSIFLLADFFPADYLNRDPWLRTDQIQREGLAQIISFDQTVHSIRPNPGVNQAAVSGELRADGRLARPTSASGLQIYRGDQYPSEYLGNAFVPEPAANVVTHFKLATDGTATTSEHVLYPDAQWQQREFLASTDERFRPVDIKLGPDGALYIIDMYHGIIQHHIFVTDNLREQIIQRKLDQPLNMGRIWRLVYQQLPLRRDVESLDPASGISHANAWQRHRAQQQILSSGDHSWVEHLQWQQLLPAAKIQVLWLLDELDIMRADWLQDSMTNSDPALRATALNLNKGKLPLATLRTLVETGFNDVAGLSERARLHSIKALLDYKTEPALTLAIELIRGREQNPHLRLVFIASLSEQRERAYQLWSESPLANSEANSTMLTAFTTARYLALREHADQQENASSTLLAMLEELARQTDQWQLNAMLSGLALATRNEDFQAVILPAEPVWLKLLASRGAETEALLLTARRAFTFDGDELAAGIVPLSNQQQQWLAEGEKLYQACAVCHQANGRGTPGLAPSLVDSPWVLGPPEHLARIVFNGIAGPLQIHGQTWNAIMPGHISAQGFDSDESVAGLLIWLRRAWGHHADPLGSEMIGQVRQQVADRTDPWSVRELAQVPSNSLWLNYVGNYGMAFLPMSFKVYIEDNKLLLNVTGQGLTEMIETEQSGIYSLATTEYQARFEGESEQTMELIIIRSAGEVRLRKK